MAKLLQHRGGTATEHSSFTGSAREVTVDTTNNTLRVHDGSTAGGHTVAKLSDITGGTSAGSFTTLAASGDVTIDTDTIKVDSTNNRVGIGTTSPGAKLDVSGNLRFSASNPVIELNNGGPQIYTTVANTLQFATGGGIGSPTEKFRMESDGDFHADGDVVAYSTTVSDVALKTDIQMIPNALDKIDEVRGVTFTRHNGQKSAGIIAQELEKVLPEAVREKELKLVDGKKYKTVEYDAIHGLLINCIKELKEEIKELKNAVTK